MHAEHIVVAIGGYHIPTIPRFAEKLPPSITQIHSSQYRGSHQFPDGDVLVVGTGQSGAQIAEDLHVDGRGVHLVAGTAPRVARFYRGRDCVAWLHDMGTYDVPIENQPGGVGKRENTNHYVTGRDGGRDIDLRAFATEGMRLYGRLMGVDDGTLRFAPTLEASLDSADAVAESIKDSIDATSNAKVSRHLPKRATFRCGGPRRKPPNSISPTPESPRWCGRSASGPTTRGSRSEPSTARDTRRTIVV